MLEPQSNTRPHAPPAKAWRNYYRLYHVLDFGFGPRFPGVHPGPSVFASKDIAESHAHAFLVMLNPPGRWFMDHAGAFPEGERAN
jgi:hypothetical protein